MDPTLRSPSKIRLAIRAKEQSLKQSTDEKLRADAGYSHDTANFMPETDKLCDLCSGIIAASQILDRLAQRYEFREDVTEQYKHHSHMGDLLRSAHGGCHLCSLLYVQTNDPLATASPLMLLIGIKLPSWMTSNVSLPSRIGSTAGSGVTSESLRDRAHVHDSVAASGFALEHQRELVFGLQRELTSDPELFPSLTHIDPIQSKNAGEFVYDKSEGYSWRTASTASNATMEVAKIWLRTCLKEHSTCAKSEDVFPGMPTRLLKLSRSNGEIAVRLVEMPKSSAVESRGFGKRVDYLALSHCWGKTLPLRLTVTNHERFLELIPVAELPRTFLDAMDITLRLGFSYIWIDALCIIQDGDNGTDWTREAAKMSEIYGNCVCSIAALHSTGSDTGCYAERLPLAQFHCQVVTPNGHTLHLEAGGKRGLWQRNKPDQMGYFDSAPLHKRGWVVQERALSPRTLYFTEVAIFWECCEQVVDESSPKMYAANSYHADGRIKFGVSRLLRQDDSWTRNQWHSHWWNILDRYSRCNLTHASDRWAAVSGLARAFKLAADSELVHGLWKTRLHQDLVWEPIGPSRRIEGAPSWSWTSIDGAVRLNGLVLNLGEDDIGPVGRSTIEIIDFPDLPKGSPHEAIPHTTSPHRLTVKAPALEFQCREWPSDDQRSNNLNYRYLESGTLIAGAIKQLENGLWLPDVVRDRHTAVPETIWAIQMTEHEHVVQGIVAAQISPMRWERRGYFIVRLHDGVVKERLGPVRTIELV